MKRFLLSVALGSTLGVLAVPASFGAEPLVFSAPPRDDKETESRVYEPIAKYLSKAIGREVIYRFPGNWLTYQDAMRNGKYDLVFDGPQFISWRVNRLGHEAIAKIPGKLAFVAVVRQDNTQIQSLKQLAGRSVCALAPPNLATLSFQTQYDNPARQPLIVEVQSFETGYQSMLEGKRCVASILRDKMFEKLSAKNPQARELWRSAGVANQGFSAGPRVTAAEKEKLREALTAEQSKTAMAGFYERFSKEKLLVGANSTEYAGLAVLLKDVWGFERAQAEAIQPRTKAN